MNPEHKAYLRRVGETHLSSSMVLPVEGAEGQYWIDFSKSSVLSEDGVKGNKDFYEVGHIYNFYNPDTKTQGKFEILEEDHENFKIKVKFLD